MNTIFENAFVCDKWKDEQVPLIIEELDPIPRPLLKFMFGKGLKIYVPRANNKLFYFRNCLHTFWEDERDERNIFETSYGSLNVKNPHIVINQYESDFVKNGYPHSVVLHEFFHAMDALLGDIHTALPKSVPLDWYAALNEWENFAVNAEAFCHPDLFVSKDYRTHNKAELYQKSPEIYRWFEQFFSEWEK